MLAELFRWFVSRRTSRLTLSHAENSCDRRTGGRLSPGSSAADSSREEQGRVGEAWHYHPVRSARFPKTPHLSPCSPSDGERVAFRPGEGNTCVTSACCGVEL